MPIDLFIPTLLFALPCVLSIWDFCIANLVASSFCPLLIGGTSLVDSAVSRVTLCLLGLVKLS